MRAIRGMVVLGALVAVVRLMAGAENPLVGVWRFDSETNTRTDGTAVEIPGPVYDGLLIYTADGHVSANLQPRGRRWTPERVTLEELRATLFDGSATGYAGRYTLDAKAGTVTHLPLVSLDPGDEGRPLVRHYECEGSRLRLSGDWEYRGEKLRFMVTWRREVAPGR